MADKPIFSLIIWTLLYLSQLTSCEDVIVQMQRFILKEGFHRDIQTVVSIQPGDIVTSPGRDCSVLLIESLPSGLYVDTFQLDSYIAFGGPQVMTDRHVDIEAPEYLSREHELHVYAQLSRDKCPSDGPVTVTTTLPVHARYHKPSPDPAVTHATVTMHNPRVLLNCSRKYARTATAPCDVHNTSICSWAEVIYKSDTYSLQFQVPVGHEEDIRVVVYGTMMVTVLGCSFLLYIIAFYDQWKAKSK